MQNIKSVFAVRIIEEMVRYTASTLHELCEGMRWVRPPIGELCAPSRCNTSLINRMDGAWDFDTCSCDVVIATRPRTRRSPVRHARGHRSDRIE